MRPRVSLQVKRIVESLAAEGTQVSLDVAVAFDVSVEEPLERENFMANPADELVVLSLYTCN
jgi:hypothetical protein